ncbi:MAG: LLM class flavin-dependent oxidoreductase [Deltaproteobacteria bacterium]|nr:LLM class flavin-dependent oxidoreductase [Deltaproteobacteria bacterium]MBW2362665.1 LLM class flavin-dependent oxidoreductase [Deltaproteobacteria bacterium]
MQLVMVHDLSAPDFGTPPADLYSAVLDMSAWADEVGFDIIALGEHHGSPDGYDPSPIVTAAAIAARTRRITIRTSVLLAPLYDPVKLAEDLAVASIFSGGRLVAGMGAGYRPAEFEAFGRRLEDRWERMAEVIAFLRRAWTGEPFDWQGRRVHITPRPEPPPPIVLGGGFARSARRAAHIADGWLPRTPDLWQPYRDECLKLGRPDPGAYPQQGPVFLHVAHDPEQAWEAIGPHARRMAEVYGGWQAEAPAQNDGPFAGPGVERDIRESPAYRVLRPDEVLELANTLGSDGTLYVTPLLCGLDPALAWESLMLLEQEVLPHLPRSPGSADRSA